MQDNLLLGAAAREASPRAQPYLFRAGGQEGAHVSRAAPEPDSDKRVIKQTAPLLLLKSSSWAL